MSRVLGLLVLLLIVVGGIGFYRGWFQVSTNDSRGSGTTNVGLTIDKDKMKADAESAKDRAKVVGNQAAGAVTPKATAAESPAPEKK